MTLNDKVHACKLTGFLPLHAVVANGLVDEYDWLINLEKNFHDVVNADKGVKTRIGNKKAIDDRLHDLTPLGLATRLGDHETTKHLLKQQATPLWIWGPCSELSLKLVGIDSAIDGGGDVMELVGRLDATKKTQQMLLEDLCACDLPRLARFLRARHGMVRWNCPAPLCHDLARIWSHSWGLPHTQFPRLHPQALHGQVEGIRLQDSLRASIY
jgi:hypothetical protein